MSGVQHSVSDDIPRPLPTEESTSSTPMVPESLDQVRLLSDDKPRDKLGKFASTKNDGWNRQTDGKFGSGNQGPRAFNSGPIVRKVQALRTVMIGCVGAKDVIEVMAALVEKAKAGDIAAIKEFLLRTFGPADAMDLLLRLDELEREVIKRSARTEAPRLQLTTDQEEVDSVLTDLAAREREVG